MFLLFETAAGYAVFKVRFPHCFSPKAGVAMSEGALGKPLKSLMKALVKNNIESLAVNNPKLGSLIKDKFQVNCVADGRVAELMRGIRKQLNSLIEEEVEARELAAMTLGLAHSLCRYKLKFSSDQADTMVIQAVGLLDELDKEINGYIMRLREWYGWHFPELGKMLTDNMTYVKVVSRIGMRQGFKAKRLKSLLSEDDIAEVQNLALHSVGSEITDEDNDRIKELCTQIIELDGYRDSLSEYMRVRMASLAPNMTALVGEVMAARLIARSGSLLNLAKSASSTVQILGAEKALFRALKSKRDTPKYGLIYHAQLIGSAPQNLKGKMARMLAAKLSLSARVDAFSERPVMDTSMALGHRANLEQKLKTMENVAAVRIIQLLFLCAYWPFFLKFIKTKRSYIAKLVSVKEEEVEYGPKKKKKKSKSGGIYHVASRSDQNCLRLFVADVSFSTETVASGVSSEKTFEEDSTGTINITKRTCFG
ncbi:Nop and NOSIC and NOP5NT domain containing protei n [Trichuris trichiura]|uniref:Nop and NOSIC and NOP5NT domain containing protei n n=1 Tax=Trichuris trichiura TaxID=36087 RepID=A0A077YVU2_TRITR|nr:Nop and NOSIC and NOP5NT domain containing protei n [Trichuris trichiura]